MSLKRLLIVLGIGLSGLTLGGCVSEGYYGSGYYDPYYYPGGTIIYDSGPAYWHDGRYYRRGWGRGWYGMAGHRPVGLFGMVGHRPVAPAGMAGLPPADPAGMADRRREAPVVPGLVPVADACPSNRSGNKPFMKEARRSAPPGSIVLRSDQRLTKTT